MVSFASALLVIVCQLYSALGCSEPANYVPWTTQRKAVSSKVVVQAKIRATFQDPKFDYGEGSRAYNAEAEVQCVFKGDTARIPAVLNVTEAGEVPGKCSLIDLKVGETYILYLFEDMPGVYIHNDFSPTVADDEALAGIKSYCGLKSEKVQGAAGDVVCPQVSGPGECVPLPVIAEPPAEPKEGQMDDGKPGKPKDPAEISAKEADQPPLPPNGATSIRTFYSTVVLVLLLTICCGQ